MVGSVVICVQLFVVYYLLFVKLKAKFMYVADILLVVHTHKQTCDTLAKIASEKKFTPHTVVSAASEIANASYASEISAMVKEYFAVASEATISRAKFSSMTEALHVINTQQATPLDE